MKNRVDSLIQLFAKHHVQLLRIAIALSAIVFLSAAGILARDSEAPGTAAASDAVNATLFSDPCPTAGIDELLDRLERGEFDLVAVGRSLIVNPSWPAVVRSGALDQLHPFSRDRLSPLF